MISYNKKIKLPHLSHKCFSVTSGSFTVIQFKSDYLKLVPKGANPSQLYRDLAWAGLFDTTIFNEKYPNNPSNNNFAERTRILDRFYAERNGTTRGQSITTGTPCEK